MLVQVQLARVPDWPVLGELSVEMGVFIPSSTILLSRESDGGQYRVMGGVILRCVEGTEVDRVKQCVCT